MVLTVVMVGRKASSFGLNWFCMGVKIGLSP
jgi:hypothetical protein